MITGIFIERRTRWQWGGGAQAAYGAAARVLPWLYPVRRGVCLHVNVPAIALQTSIYAHCWITIARRPGHGRRGNNDRRQYRVAGGGPPGTDRLPADRARPRGGRDGR